jgi:DNA repair exonuclease SbcCD nuclease subunit
MSNELLGIVIEEFKKLDGFEMYAISGNHDLQNVNTLRAPSPSYVNSFSKVTSFLNCIDLQNIDFNIHGTRYTVTGVPYLDYNIGLSDYVNTLPVKRENHILLLHSDFPRAVDTDGRVINSSENINRNLFSKFKLVLMGHIHQPQRLSKGIYMIGAPLQQRRTDRDATLGYWTLHEDFSMKFVSLSDMFPKFIDVTSQDDIVDKFNYYTVVAPNHVQKNRISTVHKGLSRSGMVRRYLRINHIKEDSKKELLLKLLK